MSQKTSRDQLTLLVDLLRRSMRHWWLVGLTALVGGGLSVALAMMQKPVYESETVLLYQEKISQSVLQGRDVAKSRTSGARFKEILLSRTTLSAIVEEFNLYPDTVEVEGTIAASEKLRLKVQFSDRGAGTYRISYRGSSPEEAQNVTLRLASLLQEKDAKVRKEQANQTFEFLAAEKTGAEDSLYATERELAVFIAKHPEFVADNTAGVGVGASIRAANVKSKDDTSGNSKLAVLQRNARRLRDRIANPDAPIVAPVIRQPRRSDSPAVVQAREELADAKRSLQSKSNLKAKHPDLIAAKNREAEITRRLKRLEALDKARAPLTPISAPITAKTSMAELRNQLSRVESAIARLRGESSSRPKSSDGLADRLVGMETEHARLQRKVAVAAQRLSSLEGRVFTAEINASSEFAEAAQLVTIDAAFLPSRPAGKGRKLIAIAGTMVFTLLGLGLALGLGLIDDRVYRRADIDELGIAPVLCVIPKSNKRNRRA